MKNTIKLALSIVRGFSYSTIFLTITTISLMIIPCLIKMPSIAPRTNGAEYSYFPGTLYADMKVFLTLLLSLVLFREVENNPLTKRLPTQLVKGLIYGVYASFVYVGISSLRQSVVLFGFSWGLHGWALIYYLTAIVLLFRYLCKYYSPWRAISASFFILFMSSIVWELPHYFRRFSNFNFNVFCRVFGQVASFSLIFLAAKFFGTKLKSFKYFLPLFAELIFLSILCGPPTPGIGGPPSPAIIYLKFNYFCMMLRITSLLGLVYIFFKDKQGVVK